MRYLGIDPPEHVSCRRELLEGEERRGWGVWRGDLYGCGSVLAGKRRMRGWGGKEEEGVIGRGCGEGVGGLLKWKGGESGVEVYGGSLPWDP